MLDNLTVLPNTTNVVQTEGITLPYRYKPYPHQEPLLDAFFDMLEGKSIIQRYALEHHRRSGKDMTFWQLMVAAAITEVGDYAYMLPTNKQAMKVIWNGTVNDCDNTPCKFFDFIPPNMGYELYKAEQRIELANGSSIYILGSDNYDSNVGMNLKGAVFSEWSLCDPKAYAFFEPMLLKNNEVNPCTGWALFCWTPRGKNHAYQTRQTAQLEVNKDFWYFSSLTVDDTVDCNGRPIFSRKAIQTVLNGGADPDLVRQEYYLDYQASVAGIIYAKQMKLAQEEGRITKVNVNDRSPVATFWDIGVADETSIWLVQLPGNKATGEFKVIDYYQASGEGMQHYVDYLVEAKKKLGFRKYGAHYLPHDVSVREWGSGDSRVDTLRKALKKAGVSDNIITVKRCKRVSDGIYQTKAIFKQLVFDKDRCKDGLVCLENYAYKVNREGVVVGEVHDKYSHGADSLRQLGQTFGILPDEASEKLMDELQQTMNEGGGYEEYNPLG